MALQPESHYNLNKLHIIFTIAAFVLLFALGGLFKKDYDRKWKEYQQQFRVLEIEQARVRYDKLVNDLKNDPEYQELIAAIEEEEKNYEDSCSDLEDLAGEIEALTTEKELLTQKYKFRTTELDVARFHYEHAVGHHEPNVEQLQNEYDLLNQETTDLSRLLEDSEEKLKSRQNLITECEQELTDLRLKQRRLAMEHDLTERKLETIDPNQMSFINRIANMIRDLPILDMSNPNYKIEQIVLKDITEDVVITQVQKVDRCITCHQGIANPAYQDAGQPFKAHPNLELFLGNESAHPMEEFGCTVCHQGRGRGTSFTSAAHTPSSEEQAEEWKEKYDWHEMHHWDKPMLPSQYVEAGCFKCHSGTTALEGAEKLNLGLNLIERAGCYNCHEIERYQDWPQTGPTLAKISGKLSKDWTWKWIDNPHAFRKDTWMPAYYHLDNNEDPESVRRGQQEIHAMVEYLFAKSADFELQSREFKGNAGRGEELVKSIGCYACHQEQPVPEDQKTTRDVLRRQHGPNLIGLGNKTTKAWLFQWLKDPRRYHPETRMPDLRLTDEEARDIAEYLHGANPDPEFEAAKVPQVDENVLDEITLDFLKKTASTANAEKKLQEMNLDQKLVFTGEKLIGRYGCYSCHDIPGFEDVKPIGAELTHQGDKAVAKLDFGFAHIPHTRQAWHFQKVKHPRSFDAGKAKEPLDKLIMPNFRLTDEEAEAVVTAILGFVDNASVVKKLPEMTPQEVAIQKGDVLVRQFNCQSCHILHDEGGTVQESIHSWLMEGKGYSQSDADKFLESFSPPDLTGTGAKLDPQWLFQFLHQPTIDVRPWLAVRMPTYHFNTEHLNLLVNYFNALDDTEFLFEGHTDISLDSQEYEAAKKLFSEEYFQCTQCHVVNGKMPSGSPETWSPDLGKAKGRLRPDWTFRWIQDPQSIRPGTKMPTFYDPDTYEESGPPDILDGDEDEQIRVLRNYLMTLAPEEGKNPPKRSEKQSNQGAATTTTESTKPPSPEAPSGAGETRTPGTSESAPNQPDAS